MEMKIIPANGGGPGMDGVFLSRYGDEDYTPRPHSAPLPSLVWNMRMRNKNQESFSFLFLMELNQ